MPDEMSNPIVAFRGLNNVASGTLHGGNKVNNGELGSVDSTLLLIPTLLVAIAFYSLFQYGFTINYLHSNAIMIGRQIAREPRVENLNLFADALIKKEGVSATDFHVMRYPIGSRVFVQLVLVGRSLRVGPITLTPSARSLTVVDQW